MMSDRVHVLQALADYRKTRALLEGVSASGGGEFAADSMWPRLMADIERAMSALTYALEAVLRRDSCPSAEAFTAIKQLLELQAAGVQAAAELDPMGYASCLVSAAAASHSRSPACLPPGAASCAPWVHAPAVGTPASCCLLQDVRHKPGATYGLPA